MKLLSTLTLAAGLALATSLQAGTIIFDAVTHQTTPPPGVTFSAIGGDVGYDFKEGIGFVGVTLPGASVEIDESQSFIITFATPQYFTNLTLGLLYDGPEYSDLNETAGAAIDSSAFQFLLTATGSTTATWNGAGATVTNLDPADAGFGAVWSISNPFGAMEVTTLTLTPFPSSPGGGGSDFGLVRFATTNSVPETASTFGLLLAGLIGLVAVKRRVG